MEVIQRQHVHRLRGGGWPLLWVMAATQAFSQDLGWIGGQSGRPATVACGLGMSDHPRAPPPTPIGFSAKASTIGHHRPSGSSKPPTNRSRIPQSARRLNRGSQPRSPARSLGSRRRRVDVCPRRCGWAPRQPRGSRQTVPQRRMPDCADSRPRHVFRFHLAGWVNPMGYSCPSMQRLSLTLLDGGRSA